MNQTDSCPPVTGVDDCRAGVGPQAPDQDQQSLLRLEPAALGARRADLFVGVTLRPPLPATALSWEGLADGANFALHVEDDRALVLERRARLQQKLALKAVQWLRQTHSSRVLPAAHFGREAEPDADAAISSRPGAAVAVLTADCLPVVLWAEMPGGPVAVAHAGWQGLANGILGNTVRGLRETAAEAPLQAWIGPSVCAAHYEVEAGLLERLIDAPVAPSVRLSGKRQLDLAALAAQQLTALGVTAVVRSGWCSYGLPVFYSHRRAQHQRLRGTGRMATLVWYG